MRAIFFSIVILFITQSCFNQLVDVEELAEGVHKIQVTEIIDGNQYIYFKALENGEESWYSTLKTQIEVGETYYFENPLEMTNFTSKELNKTFEIIYFLNQISSSPDLEVKMDINQAHSGMGKEQPYDVKIEPIEGALTIAELFAEKEKFAGKMVKIKAQVTKYNQGIMKTNWIHLQDGTQHNGKFDLTVTGNILTNVGDVIVVEGVVAINKDFGAGYSYDIIVEDVKIIKE